MIDRLATFKQTDTANTHAAFSEGLQIFAKAYAGRIDELATKLEALSVEWNKPTRFERFGEYFNRACPVVSARGPTVRWPDKQALIGSVTPGLP